MALQGSNISEIFSSLGERLRLLENGESFELPPLSILLNLATAFALTGVNFGRTGTRARPTKTLANDTLPAGISFNTSTKLIRRTNSSALVLEGWDFSGGTMYLDNGTTTLRDCYLPHASQPSLDVRNSAVVTAEFCDFDGMSSQTNLNAQVNAPSDNSVVTIRNSRIRDSNGDCFQCGSNSTLEGCLVYGPGQTSSAHPDVVSVITSPGVHENITIRNNLLIGNGPFDLNNVIRCIAEKQVRVPPVEGSTVRNVLINGNVMYDAEGDAISPPISTGRRTTPTKEGVYFGNCEISDNWISYSTAKADAGEDNAEGYAIWRNNRKIGTGEQIPGLPGWSS